MDSNKFEWFDEAKFGLFIHWGLYSLLGRGEWVMFNEKIPPEEYARLAVRELGAQFDAEQWARHAVDAGMRYAVFTTRHHDGFSLWDSQLSDFTAPKTAAKRDFVAEYVTAMRQAGLRVGLYYSLLDWRIPAHWSGPEADPAGWSAYIDYIHGQVRELLTNYGKIDMLWFDGCWPYDPVAWKADALLEMIYQLQPDILVNERTRLPGDFDTPENQIIPSDRHWETCQTSQHSWGYNNDKWVDSTWNILTKLIRAAMGGGNMLLNVGPRPDGTFPEACVQRLQEVGEWLQLHGEAIYGSERVRYDMNHWHTRHGNTLYVHFLWDLHWPSWGREYWIANAPERIVSAFIPATGEEIKVRWENGRVCLLDLPKEFPGPTGTVGLRLA